MEKRKIWLVIGTDDGWSPIKAFGTKDEAEKFVKMWENQKSDTDFEQFAAYIREVDYE